MGFVVIWALTRPYLIFSLIDTIYPTKTRFDEIEWIFEVLNDGSYVLMHYRGKNNDKFGMGNAYET